MQSSHRRHCSDIANVADVAYVDVDVGDVKDSGHWLA